MQLTFDTHGNDKQKQVCRHWLDDTVTDIVYGGSKGSGKSYLGCTLIFGDALTYPQTHYFIARKKLNDLRKHTIPSIHEVFKHWGLNESYYTYNGQDSLFTLYNGSRVYLLDAKYLPSDPMYYRFGSMQMTRGWIEEAGEFELPAMQNLAAAVGRWKNDQYHLAPKLLQTCNPAKNYLYADYYRPHTAGQLDAWKRFVQALPEDNHRLPAGYLDNLNRVLSKTEKQRLLYGSWEYDDDPTALCDYNNILALFTNQHLETDGARYLTADVARFGSDKALVGVWYNMTLVEVHKFATSTTTQLQACINAMRSKHGIPAHHCIADEDGVGGGVVDSCRIKGFINNSRALNHQNYYNLQAQCGYLLAEAIQQNRMHIAADLSPRDREELTEELEQLKSYETDRDGKLRLLPKEYIKENIGRSPDWRDMLLMRLWFTLQARMEGARAKVLRP